ncbi:hypothetical protein GCK72_011002 [Caenorhabditis remanei]|uniref:RING-type domain-containing protein n=1 Tax=Caenorhabditis remanei TaxID=31234 RepID=A0A6A5H4F0_CAERE|nr:hypothetical protein GCK72_011002 [Caenorhabditis remanei]KAF1762740.1 hypothetical protein GCK72_011002 [Caenorhabditis remanei]
MNRTNINVKECIICYNEYDFETRKPCIGICGHSICENCKHQMIYSICPHCKREDAFAITTVNYQVLEMIQHFKNMQQRLSEDSKEEGTCSECTIRSRKLRLCITCAVEAGVLKHDETKKEFVLNIVNNDTEAGLCRAKRLAICGDCALDGTHHEGHKTMQLAVLMSNLEDGIPVVVERKVDDIRDNGNKVFEVLKLKYETTIDSLKIYFEKFKDLPVDERKQHFNNIEASIEKVKDTLALVRDAIRRFEMLNEEFEECLDVVKSNKKAVTRVNTVFASMDPVVVADRKQSAREPLLIGVFNPKNQFWTPSGRMPNPKSNYAVASNKSQIFIVGGIFNGSFLPNVEMYDKDKNLRRDCNRLKRGRTRTSAGFHNGKMYVAGGYDNTYMDTVEVFDPDHEDWKDGPPLKRPRADGAVVSCNGELYALGGFNGKEYEEKIEKLNEQTQKFEVFGEMEGSRAGFGVCTFRGRIYIAGGWSSSSNTLRSVRSYDPMTNSWRDEPSLNKDRKYFTLHATSQTIYAIRGCADSWSQITEVEKFDEDRQKWDIISCTGTPSISEQGVS